MKIELNPNKMTIDELTNCIAELTAQRERLRVERADKLAGEINLHAMDVLSHAQVERDNFAYILNVELVSGRTYHIPLDTRAIKTWGIVVKPKLGD